MMRRVLAALLLTGLVVTAAACEEVNPLAFKDMTESPDQWVQEGGGPDSGGADLSDTDGSPGADMGDAAAPTDGAVADILKKADGATGCKKASDCGKPICKQLGSSCQRAVPACNSGKCSNQFSLVANAKCDSSTGACKPIAGCKKDSDCGKASCKQSGTVCVQQTSYCLAGKCTSQSKSVANATCDTSSGACKSTPGCKKDSDCGKSSCKQSGVICLQLLPRCVGGSCITQSKPVANATCDAISGACKNTPGCKKDSDCGKSSCKQTGVVCLQQIPRCLAGSCITQSKSVANAKCDTSSGACKATTGCKTNADCGKPSCLQAGSICQQSTPSCLSGTCTIQIGVAPGAKCDSASGLCKTSSVKCKKDTDCGKSSCIQVTSFCHQTNPKCLSGACTAQTQILPNAKCDTSKGSCLSSGCTKDADCGKPQCIQAGTSCAQLIPRCQSGACAALTKIVANAKCNAATGLCK